jgi:hypothetical protein
VAVARRAAARAAGEVGGGPRRGLRGHLDDRGDRHLAYAAMHSAAARRARGIAQGLTVTILALGICTALATLIVKGAAPDETWTLYVSDAALILTAGLTGINNFLDFSGRAKDHGETSARHARAANIIDLLLAVDEEDPAAGYDPSAALEELQEVHDLLRRTAPGLPAAIAALYPQYEAPWIDRFAS